MVAQGQGESSRVTPGAGGIGLGPAASGIMDVVKRQLAQNQVSQAAGPAPAAPTAPAGNGMAGIADYLKNGGTPPPEYLAGQPTPPGMPGPQTTTPATAPAQMSASPQMYSSPQGSVGTPTGAIDNPGLQVAYGRGGSWDAVNAYDPVFVDAGTKYGVDPAMLKAMMVVESGGQNIPNQNGFPNSGPMQLTSVQFGAGQATEWDAIANKLGLDITNPEHQVEIAAYALGGNHIWQGTPEEIFREAYYPTGGPDVPGGDGHTPNQYLGDVQLLMADINAANPGGAGGPITQPGGVAPGAEGSIFGDPISQPGGLAPGAEGGGVGLPPGTLDKEGLPDAPGTSPAGPAGTGFVPDPDYVSVGGQQRAVMTPESTAYLDRMFIGGTQAALDGNYGFGAASGCAGCYDDYENWDPNQHTGIDVATNQGQAPEAFNSLVSGTVICYGSQAGTANPGMNTACGAYPDYGGGGVDGSGSGNLAVLTDDGAMVTYGHTDISAVGLNNRVEAGQPLGTSGCMAAVGVCEGGYHVHLEVRLPIGEGGNYVLVDPNVYFNNGYCDQGFCLGTESPVAQPPGGVQTNPVQQSAPASNGYYTGGQYVSQTTTPAPGLGGGGYTPAPQQQQAMPAPAAYDQGVDTGQTYQVVTDASGRQYEVMADGSQRLIYDPAW